jgi:hypothetical protein
MSSCQILIKSANLVTLKYMKKIRPLYKDNHIYADDYKEVMYPGLSASIPLINIFFT